MEQTPFDTLISSRQLQMLKLMIPYTPPSGQRMLAIYAKFLELEHTIDFFRHFHRDIHAQAFDKAVSSPFDILDELRPYLSEDERNSMDSVMNIFNMMEMVRAMGEMSSEEDGHSGGGGPDPMDLMKGMLTPEQQNMFEMYNTMFNENEESTTEGDGNDG